MDLIGERNYEINFESASVFDAFMDFLCFKYINYLQVGCWKQCKVLHNNNNHNNMAKKMKRIKNNGILKTSAALQFTTSVVAAAAVHTIKH